MKEMSDRHHMYERANGYSNLFIGCVQKFTLIEDVRELFDKTKYFPDTITGTTLQIVFGALTTETNTTFH